VHNHACTGQPMGTMEGPMVVPHAKVPRPSVRRLVRTAGIAEQDVPGVEFVNPWGVLADAAVKLTNALALELVGDTA
jgi:hypothetical protein